jgi:DNA-directed RNA polymerase beta' subunit
MESIYNMQQMTHKFFLFSGYTIGIRDINISENATKIVKSKVAALVTESRKITQRLNNGKLIPPIGTSLYEFNESEQLNALERGDDFVNPIFEDIDLNSNMMARMILTGSKGKVPNFIDLNGALGAVTINGRRFGAQAGWARTSPYFLRYDPEPAANGFISTSYREGITNDVYAFNAANARHGMIALGLSTSVVGYQNRISVKNLESIITDNLRKAVKGYNIVQPLYAECGIDAARTEKVKFPTIMISDEAFEKNYKADIKLFDKKFQNKQVAALLDQEFEQLTVDRDKYRSIFMKFEDSNPKEYILNDTKHVPVNIARILDDTIYNYNEMVANMDESDRILDPIKAISTIDDLCKNLGYVFSNDLLRHTKKPIPKYIQQSTLLTRIMLRSYLCTANLIKKGAINAHLEIIVNRVVLIYKKALVEYGTSVGIIAAQSISEPLTQYVLDARHRTGGMGGTKTNGIDRLREVLGAKETQSMKNTHMMIMVKPEFEDNKLKVQEIANHIEMMNFGRFVANTRIFFEEYGVPTHPSYKHEASIINEIAKHNYGQKIPNDLANWCIRYELDREELILKSMKLETIILAVRIKHPELFIIYTPENAKVVFVRCYLRTPMFKVSNTYYEDNVIPIMNKIKDVIVRGVENITSAMVVSVMKHFKTETGALEIKKVYGIATSGTNLREILENPYIDKYRTQSDSLEETERVFGITAARSKIVNEMLVAMNDLSKFHCLLFADEMTTSGVCTSIQSTGLQKRENSNITLRLSFQHSIQVIQTASINGLTDRLSGVSANLIAGQSIPVGTAYNKVCVNEDFIKNNTKALDTVLEDL